MRKGGARDEEGATQIDALLEIPGFRRRVADPAGDSDPCRVDEHVQPTMGLDVLGDEPVAILLGRHIRRHDRGVDTEPCARRLQPVQLAPRERERVSLLAEHLRDREADPRRTTGDESRRHAAILAQNERRPPRCGAFVGNGRGGTG